MHRNIGCRLVGWEKQWKVIIKRWTCKYKKRCPESLVKMDELNPRIPLFQLMSYSSPTVITDTEIETSKNMQSGSMPATQESIKPMWKKCGSTAYRSIPIQSTPANRWKNYWTGVWRRCSQISRIFWTACRKKDKLLKSSIFSESQESDCNNQIKLYNKN